MFGGVKMEIDDDWWNEKKEETEWGEKEAKRNENAGLGYTEFQYKL